MPLVETLRLAWQDPDVRARIQFVLFIFGIYALGIHVPVPIPGLSAAAMEDIIQQSAFFQLLNTFGGGAFSRLSIFALGLGPYITASIIMQVLSMANPAWKKELQEGGQYARQQQNKRTRALTIVLCIGQSFGLMTMLGGALSGIDANPVLMRITTAVFWTAGAMFLLWLGEQVSQKGIGNGISLLIFAGIIISFPNIVIAIADGVQNNLIAWYQVIAVLGMFFATTYFIVMFTIAQRRIPIQHMRRNYGNKGQVGGHTSYLPISVNMAGVIPIIFAIALIYMPAQFGAMFAGNAVGEAFTFLARFFNPDFTTWEGWIGALVYMGLIFFFTYFWNAMMYNVDDISDNLKRGGSYIPGIRPGKQTRDFLDGVISRVTFVGATFLAIAALTQYVFPLIMPGMQQSIGMLGGTSLLIMVSVALETMRQIEANIMTKQYGQ
jgi:preprotein translocase subunit SecY